MRKLVNVMVGVLVVAGISCSLDVAAKGANSGVKTTGSHTLPADYAGSMKPYDFSRVEVTPVWADSLKPVYLAHVARHGARYISSAKKLTKLRVAIAESKAKGTLTGRGREFETLLDSVETVSNGRWGALSEVGCREEQQIAKNLYTLMPSLLKNARINAISSYVPRVAMTMYEFCHELAWMSPDVRISTAEGKEFDAFLRCFEADPEYDEYRNTGAWLQLQDSLIDATVSAQPALRIFGKKSGFSDEKLRQLTMEIYDVLQSLSAFGMPAADDRFMTESEYKTCWEADNVGHYLRNTITPYSNLAVKATAPLLAKIMADADEALDNGRLENALKRADMHRSDISPAPYSANLYFGHAETLMPLLSLMGVEGCNYESTDLGNLASEWRDYDIVPLGAHLDVILLEAPSGNIYAALQLNGKFLSPLSDGNLIVLWDDYRQYLIDKVL